MPFLADGNMQSLQQYYCLKACTFADHGALFHTFIPQVDWGHSVTHLPKHCHDASCLRDTSGAVLLWGFRAREFLCDAVMLQTYKTAMSITEEATLNLFFFFFLVIKKEWCHTVSAFKIKCYAELSYKSFGQKKDRKRIKYIQYATCLNF